MCAQIAEPYVQPPNNVNMEMAICNLKNGKETGHDQIPAESIKQGGKELKKIIYELLPKVWEEEIIPHDRKYGIIRPSLDRGRDDGR